MDRQRDDHERGKPCLAHKSEVFGVAAERLHEHLVSDAWYEARLARADHQGDAGRIRHRGRASLLHGVGNRDLCWIDVLNCDALERFVGLKRIDRGPVGQARNGEASDRGECLRRVERAGEHAARLLEEAKRLLRAHPVIDVAEGRHVKSGQHICGGAQLDEPHGAVGQQDAPLLTLDHPGLSELLASLAETGAIFDRHELDGRVPDDFFGGPAQQRARGTVGLHDAHGLVGKDDAIERLFEDGAKAKLVALGRLARFAPRDD